jgi:hypothetical protein
LLSKIVIRLQIERKGGFASARFEGRLSGVKNCLKKPFFKLFGQIAGVPWRFVAT